MTTWMDFGIFVVGLWCGTLVFDHVVERLHFRPEAVIAWVMIGIVLPCVHLLLGLGYLGAIAAHVAANAFNDWLDARSDDGSEGR